MAALEAAGGGRDLLAQCAVGDGRGRQMGRCVVPYRGPQRRPAVAGQRHRGQARAATVSIVCSPEPIPYGRSPRLAALLTWSAQQPRPPALTKRLPTLQLFLEKHEKLLSVRACWLAWFHLVRLTDGDVLALARAAPIACSNTFSQQLSSRTGFAELSALRGSAAWRAIPRSARWLKKLCNEVQKWVDADRDILIGKHHRRLRGSSIAFGLARLGETEDAKRLLGPLVTLRAAKTSSTAFF